MSDKKKIPVDELRRHFANCLLGTSNLANSNEAFEGFVVGFRVYERMAMQLGKELTEQDSRRFVPADEVSGSDE